ncbi:MAG: hypothetical protein ACYC99_12845 [Candidatus Geothermincolia bacterium]
MRKLVPVLLVLLLVGAIVAAGCGNSSVKTEAQKQIASAKAELESAKQAGVQIPAGELAKIASAEKQLNSNSVQALILATEARADINNDIQDAVNTAQATFDTASGAAQTAISKAPAGSDMTQAQQSLATAKAKAAAAKTMDQWYNPSSGAIYFANLSAQQAAAAAVAAAGAQATAAEIQRVQQGAVQLITLMRNYMAGKGANPADFKYGIQKISKDANWATGAATPVAGAPGSAPTSFLFQYENGTWVLRAAPSWTPGQFGSPTDMIP